MIPQSHPPSRPSTSFLEMYAAWEAAIIAASVTSSTTRSTSATAAAGSVYTDALGPGTPPSASWSLEMSGVVTAGTDGRVRKSITMLQPCHTHRNLCG